METSPPSTANNGHKAPGLAHRMHGLRFIAVLKIMKGVLITGIALGLFSSINRDLGQTVRTLTSNLRIDPENHIIRLILERVTTIEPKTLRTFGLISLLYASELYVEGIGLWFNQSWAEYLLVVATGFFVPEEAYACMKQIDWTRVGILILNLVVLLYVARVIWHKKRRRHRPNHE